MDITDRYVIWPPVNSNGHQPATPEETAMVVRALESWLNAAEVTTAGYAYPGMAMQHAVAVGYEVALSDAIREIGEGVDSAANYLSDLRDHNRKCLSYKDIYPIGHQS